jgi:hypothetical protein
MDWQELVSLLIVGATVGVLLWRAWRGRKVRGGELGEYGCPLTGHTAARNSVVYHARKGERPRVVIKIM